MVGLPGECIGGIVGIDMQRYHLFGTLMHQLELLEPLDTTVDVSMKIGPTKIGPDVKTCGFTL